MALAKAPVAELTLAEAIEEGWRLASAGAPVAEVARELVARGLDRDAAIATSEKGLAAFIHNYRFGEMSRALTDDNGESDKHFGQRPLSPNHGRNFAAELWRERLNANYEGADGRRKALFGFTVADCTYLRDVLLARAHGLSKKGEALATAAQLLATAGKETIADLSVRDQKRIAEMLS